MQATFQDKVQAVPVPLRTSSQLRDRVLSSSLSTEECVNIGILCLFAMNGSITIFGLERRHVVDQIVLSVFWLCSILAFISNRSRIHWELLTCKLGAIYLLWTLLSLTWDASPLSTTYSPAISSICVFLYFNYLLDRFTPSELTRLLMWAYTLLLVASFLIVHVHGFGVETSSEGNLANLGSWRGMFRQKNELGLNTALAVALCLGVVPTSGLERFWRWSLFALAMFLSFRSNSRESWIAIVIVVLLSVGVKFIAAFDPKSRFSMVVGMTSILGTLAILSYENLDSVLALFGRDRTLTGRSAIWDGTLLLISRRPWLGYGTYGVWTTPRAWDVVARVGFEVTSAHNSYLDATVTYGIIGLLLFLPIPLSAFLFSFRALMSYSLEHLKVFIHMIVVILIVSFAMSLLSYSPGVGLLLTLYAVANLEKVERSGFMSLRTSPGR